LEEEETKYNRAECEKNKSLLLRIDDLHKILLDKDAHIKEYQGLLCVFASPQ